MEEADKHTFMFKTPHMTDIYSQHETHFKELSQISQNPPFPRPWCTGIQDAEANKVYQRLTDLAETIIAAISGSNLDRVQIYCISVKSMCSKQGQNC